jgi:nitrogen regulatory protein P-II 2
MTMKTTRLRKVSIVAEAVLEEHLLRELRELGARGWTIAGVRGEGSRGVRASEWEGKNIQIDVLVSHEVADRIIEHVANEYFKYYAVVAYLVDVEVVRGDKYV